MIPLRFVADGKKSWSVFQSSLQTTQKTGLLNKSFSLAAALGVTKFKTVISMNMVTLCCTA
jgi:hypothetical protein